MKNTRPYIALRTPMSRTRPARREKSSASSSCRPNSFTSSAPATLNRSVIVVFISLLRSMPSRVIACRLPADALGRDDEQRQQHEREHREPPLEEAPWRASVNASVTTFDTTDPSVPVSARCAPITSLFMRLISAPVCVRVKKAIGMRCVWSNSERRRSKMRPSPILADHQRSPSESSASPTAIATISSASVVTMPLSCCGDGGVDDALDQQRRDDADQRLEDDRDEEAPAASRGRDGRSPRPAGRDAGRDERHGRTPDPCRACCAGPCDASGGMVSGFCVNPAGLTLLPEGCLSGRKGRPRKPLWPPGHRGFKSHTLRTPGSPEPAPRRQGTPIRSYDSHARGTKGGMGASRARGLRTS